MKKDLKNKIQKRLKIIDGQVKGVQRMVEKEEYCIDVITQISAIRSALSSVEDMLLENHLLTHAIEQMKNGKQKLAVDEILSVYKLSKNK